MLICRSLSSRHAPGYSLAPTDLRRTVVSVPVPCPFLKPRHFNCARMSAPHNDGSGRAPPDGHGKARHSSHTTSRRRSVLLLLTPFICAATTCAQEKYVATAAAEPDAAPKFRTTPTGVKIQDVLEGTGPQVNPGDVVEFNYVLRRANGYYVFSTIDLFGGLSEPAVFPLGMGKIIPGLEEVLLGMKPGGKRRALVPPNVGYIDLTLEPQPQDFGPRRSLLSHIKEPLVFEVQLLKIK